MNRPTNADIESIKTIVFALSGILWILIIAGAFAALIFSVWTKLIPYILEKLAAQNNFITKVPEGHFGIITSGGKFQKVLLQVNGWRVDNTHNVVKGSIQNTMKLQIERLVHHFGYFWLGWQPGIHQREKIKLPVTKLVGTMSNNTSYNELHKCFRDEVLEVTNVRATMTSNVFVGNIEMKDDNFAAAFVIAEVVVTNCYNFWYGNGQKNAELMRIIVTELVRNEFEQSTVLGLLREGDQDRIEKKLSEGITPTETDLEQYGFKIKTIRLIYWDFTASDETNRLIQTLANTETKIQQVAADAALQIETAERAVQIAESEAKKFDALKNLNKTRWEAILHLTGNDSSTAHLILQKEEIGDDLARILMAKAIQGLAQHQGPLVLGSGIIPALPIVDKSIS